MLYQDRGFRAEPFFYAVTFCHFVRKAPGVFPFFRKRGRWFLNFGFSGAIYWDNDLFVSVISRNILFADFPQIAPEPVLFNEFPFVLSFFSLSAFFLFLSCLKIFFHASCCVKKKLAGFSDFPAIFSSFHLEDFVNSSVCRTVFLYLIGLFFRWNGPGQAFFFQISAGKSFLAVGGLPEKSLYRWFNDIDIRYMISFCSFVYITLNAQTVEKWF